MTTSDPARVVILPVPYVVPVELGTSRWNGHLENHLPIFVRIILSPVIPYRDMRIEAVGKLTAESRATFLGRI